MPTLSACSSFARASLTRVREQLTFFVTSFPLLSLLSTSATSCCSPCSFVAPSASGVRSIDSESRPVLSDVSWTVWLPSRGSAASGEPGAAEHFSRVSMISRPEHKHTVPLEKVFLNSRDSSGGVLSCPRSVKAVEQRVFNNCTRNSAA